MTVDLAQRAGALIDHILKIPTIMPNQMSSTAQDLLRGKPSEIDFLNGHIVRKGAELGRFEMGSTVMLLFEKDTVDLLEFEEKQKMIFGQPIALFTNKPVTPAKAAKTSTKGSRK